MERASGVSYGWQVCRFVPYVDAGVIARTPDESDAVRVGIVFERAENGFGVLSSLVFPRGKRAPSRVSLRNANTAPKTPPSSCTAGYLRVPDARDRFIGFVRSNLPTLRLKAARANSTSLFPLASPFSFSSTNCRIFSPFLILRSFYDFYDRCLSTIHRRSRVARMRTTERAHQKSANWISVNRHSRTFSSGECRDTKVPDELMPSVTRGSNDFNY